MDFAKSNAPVLLTADCKAGNVIINICYQLAAVRLPM
jgi:hypothetical protein